MKLSDHIMEEPKEHVLAPFFGLHPGSRAEEMKAELKKFRDLGIYKVNVEYSAGAGTMQQAAFDETFFAAADGLCKALSELGMSFWLQDAAPFPTGYANGALLRPEHADKAKLFIEERHLEVTGPCKGAVLRVDQLMRSITAAAFADPGELAKIALRKRIAVVACRLTEDRKIEDGSLVRLDREDAGNTAGLVNARIEDGFLTWDVPEGHWRVYVLFTTTENHGRKDYVNLLSKDSVRLLIDEVHAPVTEHLQQHLGKEWNGFFYDEPECGNAPEGTYFSFTVGCGRRQHAPNDNISLPWSPEMPKRMEAADSDWILHLPYLYYDGQGDEAVMRYRYMDCVTSLVRDNYNGQVHAWMRDHNVPYIGHVLEDENSHSRLGVGLGHYFRTEHHQDMAGIDLISAQLMPGDDLATSWYGASNGDGEFYHYMLAKLASSEAHINPEKQGKSFCEVFAVYGSVASPKFKKYILDHLMVNGIHRFILGDAFTHGMPEQALVDLHSYVDRMHAFLDDKQPVTNAAVLYHADMEWAGYAEPSQKPAAELARHQISYDIIPADVFAKPESYDAHLENGLVINGNTYRALIIPGCAYLPEAVCRFAKEMAGRFPVFFTDRVPERICETGAEAGLLNAQSVPLEALAETVRKAAAPDLAIREYAPWIRTLHVTDGSEEAILVHNEALREEANLHVRFEAEKNIFAMDPLSGRKERLKRDPDDPDHVILPLDQWQMKILYSDDRDMPPKMDDETIIRIPRNGWEIFAQKDDENTPKILSGATSLVDLSAPEHLGHGFSGKILYKGNVTIPETEDEHRITIDLGKVYECAEVEINGKPAGTRFAPPYLFDVTGLVKKGENTLTITVHNSPVNHPGGNFGGLSTSMFDASVYAIMEPTGIIAT